MDNTEFGRPVFVKDGRNLVREIACLGDALAFLRHWPDDRRGPIYNAAARACEAAYRQAMPAPQARTALIAFARAAGILEQAPVMVEPWMINPKSGRGGVPT